MKKSQLGNIIRESIKELMENQEAPVEIFNVTDQQTGETFIVNKNHEFYPGILNQIKKGNSQKLNEVACNEGKLGCCGMAGGCCGYHDEWEGNEGQILSVDYRACCWLQLFGHCCTMKKTN